MRDLAPDASRLISYALDLDVEVSVARTDPHNTLAGMTIADGLVKTTYARVRTSSYRIDNTAKTAKRLIVEQGIEKSCQLLSRKSLDETTSDLYRFAIRKRSERMRS